MHHFAQARGCQHLHLVAPDIEVPAHLQQTGGVEAHGERAVGLVLDPLRRVKLEVPRALGGLMPHLAGRVEGLAVRVPTPAVAMLDLVAELAADADAEGIRDAFRAAAAEGPLAGILAVVEDERVSSDFVGRPESAVVDLPLVAVADRRLARVIAWYDNEWGYSARCIDMIRVVA